ncbi:MAG: glutamate 5-kinase [Sphaerochaetaceae bacterium]|nr:glutamate 5-kinase [Sphaerochaetaceae bacterium]
MRDFSDIKTVVVKVGTNLLSTSSGIDSDRIQDIADQIANLWDKGYQVILVSSGAIGMGAKALKHNNPVRHIPLRQACASIGNPLLMTAWQKAFSKHNKLCGQVLITRNVLNNRTGYNNMRAAVSTLLGLGVIPIFNENDVVSTSEINNVFGDNDRMSAYVASKIDADLLILLTDIDAVYTGNPKTDPNAVKLDTIAELDAKIFSYAKGAGSTFSTGGMKTKLLAAQIAQKGGCGTIIASGYEKDALSQILQGQDIGTYILPETRLAQRQRWILNTPSSGSIILDEGAVIAIKAHKSLLPSGIKDIVGVFNDGDVVDICAPDNTVILKAVTSFNSSDLIKIKGHNSKEIAQLLGDNHKVVFRPEDSVYL